MSACEGVSTVSLTKSWVKAGSKLFQEQLLHQVPGYMANRLYTVSYTVNIIVNHECDFMEKLETLESKFGLRWDSG